MIKFSKKLFLAHRGYTQKFQENTIEAFQDAILNKDIDGVEFDVMQTLDGVPICFHDDNMKRLTGIDEDIKSISYDYLSELRIKKNIGNGIIYNTNPKIPRLDETLDLFRNTDKILNLELKIDYLSEEFVKNILNLISERKMEEHTIITSFNHQLLELIDLNKFNVGSINNYDICDNDINKMSLEYPFIILDKRTNKNVIKELQKKNKIVGIYTINSYDDSEFYNFDNYFFDFIIFDQLFIY